MSQEMYARLFDGAAKRRGEIEMLEETYRQALELMEANQWDEAEGLLIIFANGLAYLRGERRLTSLDEEPGPIAAELTRVTRELIDTQSKYSVMKFRAFTLQEDNQVMDWHNNAYRVENRGLAERIKMFREDEKRLKARVQELEAENNRLRALLTNTGAASFPQERPGGTSLLPRFRRWRRQR